jgi:hypothetical protein
MYTSFVVLVCNFIHTLHDFAPRRGGIYREVESGVERGEIENGVLDGFSSGRAGKGSIESWGLL